MGYIEVQRGKKAMKKEEFYAEVGTTAACTLRTIKRTEYSGIRNRERQIAKEKSKRHLYICDSWFGSVKVAENVKLLHRVPKVGGQEGDYDLKICREKGQNPDGHEIIGAVKTNSGSYPKKEIEKIMRDWPSGAYIVLECKTPDTKVDLVAIGYKYNAKKVLCFVMTKNAGSTAPGDPYIAKFPDKFGNVQERHVPRPAILSTYFQFSDVIDSHNHCRQFRLGLERLWMTINPWFRVDCTLVGMTAIDAFRCLQYHYGGNFKGMTVANFADGLARDCVYNPFSKEEKKRGIVPSANNLNPDCFNIAFEQMRDQWFSTFSAQSELMMNQFQGQHSELLSACQSFPSTVTAERAPRESTESALTDESPSNFISSVENSQFAFIDIGEHKLERTKKLTKKGDRAVRSQCVICEGKNNKSSLFCSNPICKTMFPKGCWICDPIICGGPRKTEAVGGDSNTKTCYDIHLERIRNMKYEEYKQKSVQRMISK